MSINTKQQIKCPGCGNMSEMTVWQSITVSDSPDLKEDLLRGNINIFRCSSCNSVALIPTPFLYNDEENKLMISFSPCQTAEEKLQQFESVKKSSKESGELEGLSEYNLRFVTEYNSLLEKILIFDSGLHDKVIEVIKLLVLMQEPDKMDQRVCIFGKVDDEIEFIVQDRKDGGVYTSRVPMHTYELVRDQLKSSGVKYKSFGWEIVDGEYAAGLLHGANNPL